MHLLGALLLSGFLKRKENHKHEQTMSAETNKATLELAKQSDNAALELAKLEADLRRAELKHEEKIVQLTPTSTNDVRDLQRFANSNSFRRQGTRPFA